MSEKNEAIKARIQMFKDDYALPIVTGSVVTIALFATAYLGAREGANAAVKKIKVNVQMLDSEGNPLRLKADNPE